MGIGINVNTGKMSTGNENGISIIGDTVIGKSSGGRYYDTGGPFMSTMEDSFSEEDAVEIAAKYLERRQKDVIAGESETTNAKAFDENGHICTEVTMLVPGHGGKTVYTEVAKDGFYLYPSPKAMDSRDPDQRIFVEDAAEAMEMHMKTINAFNERKDARDKFVDDHLRDDRLTRDGLKRHIKSAKKRGESTTELKAQLKEAQETLDRKRDEIRELQGYKDLLVPGPNENVLTLQRDDSFAAAIESMTSDDQQMTC